MTLPGSNDNFLAIYNKLFAFLLHLKMITNRHSEEIDKIIANLERNRQEQWEIIFKDNTHKQVANFLSHGFFTNLINSRFPKKYLSKFACVDCGGPSQHRCHEVGNPRPLLVKKALEAVWPDTTKAVTLRDIAIEFFKQHKTTKFDFKCKECHSKEARDPKVEYI
ncbi:hypothetical protein MT325_m826L [Paramecium bursaria chlorella virus MT325]|uniref:Uncharacterized protein m826L n=1 Tax=Paramecium bursaria Chlorella virus MT325 TaxID=346932 RepID=A7IVK6_PBCVM|nr:hypothetical protein MT325_m826L [Paramecium bursaria chlorella virus MT325]